VHGPCKAGRSAADTQSSDANYARPTALCTFGAWRRHTTRRHETDWWNGKDHSSQEGPSLTVNCRRVHSGNQIRIHKTPDLCITGPSLIPVAPRRDVVPGMRSPDSDIPLIHKASLTSSTAKAAPVHLEMLIVSVVQRMIRVTW
jgi:hypothetical protein